MACMRASEMRPSMKSYEAKPPHRYTHDVNPMASPSETNGFCTQSHRLQHAKAREEDNRFSSVFAFGSELPSYLPEKAQPIPLKSKVWLMFNARS